MEEYLLGYDDLTEEYYITGPQGFTCVFRGKSRASNSLLVLRILNEH